MKVGKSETKKVKTNKFWVMANELQDKPIDTAELENLNVTKEYYEETETEIKEDEILKIKFSGKPRTGKSTAAIAEGIRTFELLKKHNKAIIDEKFNIKSNIARDQNEYSRMMTDPTVGYTVVVKDEVDDLEDTGENVTAENALLAQVSNVQAGRYVHTIECSPRISNDPNNDIFLDVVAKDKERRVTVCHLYYRLIKGGQEIMQLLGYVEIPVGKLIGTWEDEVKKHFQKPHRSKEDEKIIETYRKTDLYTEYIIRKYQKMDLITKNGVMRPRELHYAEVLKDALDKMKPIVNVAGIFDRNLIRNQIEIECRKRRIPMTIIQPDIMAGRIEGILKSYISLRKIKAQISECTGKEEKKGLTEAMKATAANINEQEGEIAKLVKIKAEYERVDSDGF